MMENKSLTGEIIKNRILGIEEKPRTLITVIQEHSNAIEFCRICWNDFQTHR